MKTLLLVLMVAGSFAHAESVTGVDYTYALLDGKKCNIAVIPDAAEAAVNAALNKAKERCENPIILEARILSVIPVACRSWTAGFRATAEVKFVCQP